MGVLLFGPEKKKKFKKTQKTLPDFRVVPVVFLEPYIVPQDFHLALAVRMIQRGGGWGGLRNHSPGIG